MENNLKQKVTKKWIIFIFFSVYWFFFTLVLFWSLSSSFFPIFISSLWKLSMFSFNFFFWKLIRQTRNRKHGIQILKFFKSKLFKPQNHYSVWSKYFETVFCSLFFFIVILAGFMSCLSQDAFFNHFYYFNLDNSLKK